MKNIALIVVAVVLVTLGIAFFGMNTSANNKYTALEARAEAVQDVNKATFDKVWKVIQGQGKVAASERESFRKTYVEIMTADTANEQNLMMKWAQRANVSIDNTLYRNLQNSIDSQKSEFLEAQKELIDVRREATALKRTFPYSMFLGNRKDIKIQLVTSAKTAEAFETGEENEMDLGLDK